MRDAARDSRENYGADARQIVEELCRRRRRDAVSHSDHGEGEGMHTAVAGRYGAERVVTSSLVI
jgi:hypothetical protein